MRLLLFTLLFCTNIYAESYFDKAFSDFCVLCVDELSVEFTEIVNKKHFFFPDYTSEDWTYGLGLNWDVRAMEILYWKNHSYFDMDSRVKHIGWDYEVGANLGKNISIFWRHHSQHIAEGLSPDRINNSFPIDDRYGVRIYFINN